MFIFYFLMIHIAAFQRMVGLKIKPTAATYNALIAMYARVNNLDKVDSLYAQLKKETVPDLVTFTTLLECYKKAGRLDDMRKAICLMGEMGYVPKFAKYPFDE
jgi:pentatricopeptide repeat protein